MPLLEFIQLVQRFVSYNFQCRHPLVFVSVCYENEDTKPKCISRSLSLPLSVRRKEYLTTLSLFCKEGVVSLHQVNLLKWLDLDKTFHAMACINYVFDVPFQIFTTLNVTKSSGGDIAAAGC